MSITGYNLKRNDNVQTVWSTFPLLFRLLFLCSPNRCSIKSLYTLLHSGSYTLSLHGSHSNSPSVWAVIHHFHFCMCMCVCVCLLAHKHMPVGSFFHVMVQLFIWKYAVNSTCQWTSKMCMFMHIWSLSKNDSAAKKLSSNKVSCDLGCIIQKFSLMEFWSHILQPVIRILVSTGGFADRCPFTSQDKRWLK